VYDLTKLQSKQSGLRCNKTTKSERLSGPTVGCDRICRLRVGQQNSCQRNRTYHTVCFFILSNAGHCCFRARVGHAWKTKLNVVVVTILLTVHVATVAVV